MAHFYPHCAQLISLSLSQSSSIKALISSHCPPPEYTQSEQKRYLATVINTLAWRQALEEVIDRAEVWDEGRGGKGKEVKRTLGPVWRRYLDEGRRHREATGNSIVSSTASASSKDDISLKQRNDQSMRYLLLVLIHDVLFSPAKRLSTSPNWPPSKLLAGLRPRLHAELVKLQIRRGKGKVEELRIDWQSEDNDEGGRSEGRWKRGRWIRVNTRKVDVAKVVAWLEKRGYTACRGDFIPRSGTSLQDKRFLLPASLHPPDLMLLPLTATSELAASDLYKRGEIILQDAASCWPAWLLLGGIPRKKPRKAIHVLDATASPGNKTSHLSAILSHIAADPSQVTLTALERDPRRYKTLLSQLARAGCLASTSSSPSKPGLVYAHHADFLSLDPVRDPRVKATTHMLIDPSCSGSGIVGRLDWLTSGKTNSTGKNEQENEEEESIEGEEVPSSGKTRLERLAEMQFKMIEHSFKFPSLKRFVYSTCSIHRIEDEQVVYRALASPWASDPAGRWRWTLAPRSQCLPQWPWRGEAEASSGDAEPAGEEGKEEEDPTLLDSMLRAYPYAPIDDQGPGGVHVKRTNGFFAACFVKVYAGDETDVRGCGCGSEEGEKVESPHLEKRKRRQEDDTEVGGNDDEEEEEDDQVESRDANTLLTPEERRKRKKREAKKRSRDRARQKVVVAAKASSDSHDKEHTEDAEEEWMGCRD